LLGAAQRIHGRRPDVRFLVACLKEEHRLQVAARAAGRGLPIEAHAGRTPESIQLAHSCLAVSGSVSLELLWRAKPSVIVYHHHPLGIAASHLFRQCRYISLVNLLAGKLLFPEYLSGRSLAVPMADHVLHWLEDASAHATLRGELDVLRRQVGEPGACARAARAVLDLVDARRSQQAA